MINSFEILSWYRNHCRPFLEKTQPDSVTSLDADVAQIEKISERKEELVPICFLGNAAIGKSTLINALVAETEILLPSGGIGPLTAQATSVRYSKSPYFRATYHDFKELWHLILALEFFQRRLDKDVAINSLSGTFDAIPHDLDAREEHEIKEELSNLSEEQDSNLNQPSKKMKGKIRQANLLIKGNQDGDTEIGYLIDCLLEVVKKPKKRNHTPTEEDRIRIERLSKIIELTKKQQHYSFSAENTNDPQFREELRIHAAGFVSPLICSLEVGWPSELLKTGLALVDLPGIGIANDRYQEVTYRWIREEARAIVMVLDRGGINEGCAKLLQDSGFMTRLLHAADNPDADPTHLLIAVTRVDDLAETAYKEHRDKHPQIKKKKNDFLLDIRQQLKQRVAEQMSEQLQAVENSRHDLTNQSRKEVVQELLKGMSIHPVSAPQYTKLLAEDEDDIPFIKSVEESGVPELMHTLQQIVQQWKHRVAMAEEIRRENLQKRISTSLKSMYGRLRSITKEIDEAEKLVLQINNLLEPLKKTFYAKRGAFQEFLTKNLSNGIQIHVKEATAKGREDAHAQISKMNQAIHWSTLRAAIRSHGIFSGAMDVDLVRMYSLSFEDPIATIWSNYVLKAIRQRFSEVTKEYIYVIQQSQDRIKYIPETEVYTFLFEQYNEMLSLANSVHLAGEDLVDDLRDDVQKHLRHEIETSIRQACSEFTEQNKDKGKGVKVRMNELLYDLSQEIASLVATFAIQYLRSKLEGTKEKIRENIRSLEDPFEFTTRKIQELTSPPEETKQARKLLETELKNLEGTYPKTLLG